MANVDWTEWLETVPDAEDEGVAAAMRRCAERCDCPACPCPDLASYCVGLIEGDSPREWLGNAYETIMLCCLQEEETIELLMHLYEQAKSGAEG